MHKPVLAVSVLAVFLVGLLTGCAPQTDYYSVVQTQMPGGYVTTAVQNVDDYQACEAATQRYVEPLRSSCADCRIVQSGCSRSLSGEQKALWEGHPGSDYSLVAGQLRILISGPVNVTQPVCLQLAKDIAAKGAQASCMPPLGK
jgi:hypothetical protein